MRKILFCLAVVLFCVCFAQAKSNEVKKQLVEQMISNDEITRACVKEQGGASKAIEVTLLYLNRDKQPEYLVSGTGACCVGSVRCAASIYQKTATGYKRIYEGGANQDIEVLKSRTNGYRNLRGTLIMGSETHTAIFKFNGSRYQ